jgi:hypothetical protein
VTQPWPIQITALTPAACGAARWRTAGASWVTVIVKATFDLVHGQSATLAAPREIVREDRYRERTGSLEQASETAPYLPSAGVLLSGHAHAPGGRAAPSAAARLAIVRERPLLDKTVHVFGDRALGATHAQPFVKMPLVYERAYGGAGTPENPVGVGIAGTAAQPNVLDTTSPLRPAGFGPISRYWPARRRLLGSGDERGLLASDPAIPEGFDWRYFHAAPPDQQIELLRGDEWIVLDGLHPTLPRVQTKLPSAVARARWHLATSSGIGPAQTLELAADMLVIDADRLLCSVVWRGRFQLMRPDLAPWVRVFAGVELGGQPIPWGRRQDAAAVELGVADTVDGPMRFGPNGPLPIPPSPAPLAGTSELDLRAVLATILPFAAPDPWRPPSAAVKAEATQPVITRAPESLAETGALDLRHILSAIVPFKPTKPSSLAMTGGMDNSALRAAVPFMPSDGSRPVLAAVPQSVVARVPSSLGGTADEDMQQAIRAILPFLGAPGAAPPQAEPAQKPSARLDLPSPPMGPSAWSSPPLAADPPNSAQPLPPRAKAPLAETANVDLQAVLRRLTPFAGAAASTPAVGAPERDPLRPIAPSAVHILSPVVSFTPGTPRSPLGATGAMDDQPLRPALPFLALDPVPPILEAKRQGEPPPTARLAADSIGPDRPAATAALAGASPPQSSAIPEPARDPFRGVSLADYAAVQVGLGEKVHLDTVLQRERIAAAVWPTADAAWSRRIAEDLTGEGALQEPFDAHLAAAQDRYGRRVPPLDDDLEAWIAFQRRLSTDTNPPALFAQLGLRPAEVARLRRNWSKRLRAEPELAKRARELLEKQPADRAVAQPAREALP